MALPSTELRGLVNVLEELYLPVGSDEYPDRVITPGRGRNRGRSEQEGPRLLRCGTGCPGAASPARPAGRRHYGHAGQPVPENFDHSGDGPLLTPRQTRILQLVADGRADREVGRMLGISTRTVHAHLQRIYRALNVTSRTEALARLRERSLTASARRARNSGS
jgi:DNA-binding CsgD family transcriptional regulator